MKIILQNIIVPVSYSEEDILEKAKKIIFNEGIIFSNCQLFRKSLDARRKSNIHYVCAVLFECDLSQDKLNNITNPDIKRHEEKHIDICSFNKSNSKKTIVVGTGPCGLFAAYILAKTGQNPLVIERGSDVDKRTEIVNNFWNNNIFDADTNV